MELQLENVTKSLGGFLAVDDVSFSVDKGTFLTLLGPSGCGKTTTLRLILGLIRPTTGEIYCKGERITTTPTYKRNIGMVFQSYALFPFLNVFDNIAFGLKLHKVPRDDIKRRVQSVLDLVGLTMYGDRFPNELSGGQQQRVAVARSLVLEPNILLMDEPLSNLDFKIRLMMRQEIRNLTRKVGITTVYVTHDQSEALSMSDKIAVMNKGKVIAIGSPLDLYHNPNNEFIADFLGEANLLEGTIVGADENVSRVKVSNDMVIESSSVTGNPTKKVLLSIRPERLKLSKEKQSSPNSFPCEIQAAEFNGPYTKYHILVGGTRLVCFIPNEGNISFANGDKVYAFVDPKSCVVLNPAH
jgi:spermidine/putrescine transport system ATP-binding protein